jgi:hypothetical protein
LSTVHYNLQALVKANLVKAEEFHYSEKGKEVLHYSLANKIIIIAPKNTRTESFRDKLKSILPVALITLAVGAVMQIFNKFMFKAGSAKLMAADYAARSVGIAEQAVEKAAVPAAEEAASLMMTAASGAAENLAENATNITHNITQNITEQVVEPVIQPIINVVQQTPPTNTALWFLIGAGFTIMLLIIWYWFVTRKKK